MPTRLVLSRKGAALEARHRHSQHQISILVAQCAVKVYHHWTLPEAVHPHARVQALRIWKLDVNMTVRQVPHRVALAARPPAMYAQRCNTPHHYMERQGAGARR